MTMLKNFKTGARVALVALVLGGTAMTAIPAQAAGPSFSIQFGTSDYNNYMGGKFKKNHAGFHWDVKAVQWKLSQTYRQVSYQRTVRGDYFFVGKKGNTWYQLRVDGRTGRVWAMPVKQNRGGGFSFNFNF